VRRESSFNVLTFASKIQRFPCQPLYRHRGVCVVSGVLVSAVWGVPALAEVAPPPEAPDPTPAIGIPADPAAIYDLVVNQAPRGEVVVYLRGSDVWIPWQDLVNAGLRDIGGDREIIAGVEHVSLV